MSNPSTAELEREAEVARADVTETADAIRQKMTPGQLIDEFTGMFSGGDTSAAMQNLKSQVRDNPLPLALIGTGLAWLMFGPQVSPAMAQRYGQSPGDLRARVAGQDDQSSETPMTASPGDDARALSDVAKRIGDAAGSARDNAGNILSSVNATSMDAVRSEPLILAAVGLAMGTVAGTLLPRTDFEDEQLGPIGDDLREQAQAAMEDGLEGAKAVAGEAYASLKDEADDRMQDEGTVAEKVSDVVRNTAAKTEDAIRSRVGQAKQ